jgi:hypothetical protein
MARSSFADRADERGCSNSLDVARTAFNWLVTGPRPLSVNGRRFPGLPHRPLPLDEVRDRLLARGCPQATRDAVWAHLVLRSRTSGGTWTVGAVGMAMPALTAMAATLSKRFPADPADIHAEVLRGFLTAMTEIDLRPPRIMLRLRWAAYRSGYDALATALAGPMPAAPGFQSAPPRPPWGHPDLVLARAVADGVLTRTEADLIGATRLEQVPLANWASDHQASEWATYKTRKRAEFRLAAYLREESVDHDPADPLNDRMTTSTALARSVKATGNRRVPSLSVSTVSAGSAKKTWRRMSKKDPKSGVQGCGTRLCETHPSEVPPCA